MADVCEKCGTDRDTYVIKTSGGQTVCTVSGPCACPLPCCFACHMMLDADGRCGTTLCYMDGLIVPIPEMRPQGSFMPIPRGEAQTYG